MVLPDGLHQLIGHPRPIILDIGCNDGAHTRMFMDMFPYGTVYSFEPDLRAQQRFLKNVSDASRLIKLAVGSVDGLVDFYPSAGLPAPLPKAEAEEIAARLGGGGWDYSGSLREPKLHLKMYPWCTFGEKVSVPSIRLDTWSRQYNIKRVDFIWADVQGAEVDLIAGGRETLEQTRFFYTEYNDKELYAGQISLSKILKLLPNFEVVTRYPDDVLLRNTVLEQYEL